MSQAWNIYEPTFAVPLLIRANRCNNFIKTQKKIQRKFIAQASTLILHSFIRRSHRHIQNITSLHVFVNIIFMYYFSFLSFFFFIKFWVQCSTMIVHINLNEPNSGYIFCCSCRLLCYFYCIFVFSILFISSFFCCVNYTDYEYALSAADCESTSICIVYTIHM